MAVLDEPKSPSPQRITFQTVIEEGLSLDALSVHELLGLKWQAQQALEEQKQGVAADRKLKKLDSNNLDVKALMSDNMLVNRYTEHLCNIMFNYSDPFLKEKYRQFKGGGGESFFERMQNDMKKREESKVRKLEEDREQQLAMHN